jgi:energy-coupling factor transporter ATP-binding protein EcfA2
MPGPVTNLRSLDSANFKTSKRADGVNDVLKAKLGLQHRYEPARLAIAHSLALADAVPPLTGDDADDSGKVIMGKTLFGDDELPVWVALIVEKSGLPHPSVEDIQEQVRRHWHRGIMLLQAEWESCAAENSEGVYERFILFLAQRAGLPAHGLSTGGHGDDEFVALTDRRAVPVSLRLGDPGTDERTGTPATWLLNGKGSPHVALMGGTGSGKTRLARCLLGQIRTQTKVPCVIFDFKGDLAGNPAFVSDTGATVIAAPNTPVPLDVLHIADVGQAAGAAVRFRDSFVRIPKNRPGAVQADELRDAARTAFQRYRPGQPIRLETIRDELTALYADRPARSRGNVLTATFNELTQWQLFEPRLPPADFFRQSWIIDVHGTEESAQRLIVFLVLDALYAHCKALPDSEMDAQGHRALRVVLVVDEARRVLSYGQPSLISLVRESRSKGMSVFLISQSPEDYDTAEEDFLDQIGLTVCFKANGTSPRVLKACLGQTVDLAGLPDGMAVTRLPGQTGVSRIKAWE